MRVNGVRVRELGLWLFKVSSCIPFKPGKYVKREKPLTYLEGTLIITGFQLDIHLAQPKLLMYNLIRVSKCSECLGLRCRYWRE